MTLYGQSGDSLNPLKLWQSSDSQKNVLQHHLVDYQVTCVVNKQRQTEVDKVKREKNCHANKFY